MSYDQTKPCKWCGAKYDGWKFNSAGHIAEYCRAEMAKRLEAAEKVIYAARQMMARDWMRLVVDDGSEASIDIRVDAERLEDTLSAYDKAAKS